MSYTDFPTGLRTKTENEIDHLFGGGFGSQITNMNAVPVVVLSTAWTQQSGGPFDDWYYADLTHPVSQLSYVIAFRGADAYIRGDIRGQQEQSASTLRIWLTEEPTYNILCLVVYV